MTKLARRTVIQSAAAFVVASPVMTAFTKEPSVNNTAHELTGKVFPPSDRVICEKATFRNRFGITIDADLYRPKDATGKLPGLAVCGPFGAVKEQSSGLYAQTLAEAGFVAVAFDPSFTGQSGGEPRHVASPDLNTEDFCAAVDFLSTHPLVDGDRIGIVGICGWGGMALSATAADARIRAAVTVTMYDMHRVTAYGYFDQMTADGRKTLRRTLSEQRTKDYVLGSYAPAPGLPETLSGNEPAFVKDYWDYYKTPRGFHARSINSNGNWNATSAMSLLNFPILTWAGEIDVPVLLVHGEKAHSRYFSEDAFKRLNGKNKELFIVPEASHTDLYDNKNRRIPWEKITSFLKANLA